MQYHICIIACFIIFVQVVLCLWLVCLFWSTDGAAHYCSLWKRQQEAPFRHHQRESKAHNNKHNLPNTSNLTQITFTLPVAAFCHFLLNWTEKTCRVSSYCMVCNCMADSHTLISYWIRSTHTWHRILVQKVKWSLTKLNRGLCVHFVMWILVLSEVE